MTAKQTHWVMVTIDLLLILIVLYFGLFVFVVPAHAAEGWTERQKQAHEVAEIARRMGLPENDPIIARAQELWQGNDAKAYITDPPLRPF